MQLIVLLLMMSLLAHDWTTAKPLFDVSTTQVLAGSLLPYLLPCLASWVLCRWSRRKMSRRPQRAPRTLSRLSRALTVLGWLTIGIHLSALFIFNLPGWLHAQIGSWVLLNELIIILPPTATLIFMWWAYFPVDRRIREQALLRQLDEQQPVFSFCTRGQYVMDQVRHQLLIVMLPLLLLLGWMQVVMLIGQRVTWVGQYEAGLSALGGLCMFAFAPLVIRFTWRTTPLPGGPLRTRLEAMCREQNVGIAELLLWRTHGGMINGAVMGLFAPIRYILLTDGLIDRMYERQIEAVMAHELGHVRRHHMPRLAICRLGTLFALFIAAHVVVLGLDELGWIADVAQTWREGTWLENLSPASVVVGTIMLCVFVLWAMLFGFISRRFERQADTFAVQHFTQQATPEDNTITPQAIDAMAGALRAVCDLNSQPTSRKSWRHGSIDWRIAYLRSLEGLPADKLSIDRVVRQITWICALLFALSIASQM